MPQYSTPFAAIGNFAIAARPEGGNFVLDLTSGDVVGSVPGITGGARLHPDGWAVYTVGSELRRWEIATGTDELVRDFGAPVGIGGGEGGFSGDHRRLVVHDAGSDLVRVYDLTSDELWEARVPQNADAALLALNGRQVIVHQRDAWQLYEIDGAGIEHVGSLGYGTGHADVGKLPDGRDCLVVTSSNWAETPWPGSEKWILAIPLIAGISDQDLLESRIIKWSWSEAVHLACHDTRLLISTYAGAKSVFLTATGERDLEFTPGTDDGAVPRPQDSPIVELIAELPNEDDGYWSQPHAAWSAEGDRAFYGRYEDAVYHLDWTELSSA